MSTYDEALAILDERGPGRMVPDLERIRLLTELLAEPQHNFPSIHVTGTNGKSSVVRMVSALAAASGLTAGTYTSPHLQTVRERFSVAGRRISEPEFAELVDEVEPYAQVVDAKAAELPGGEAGDRVTYFELTTAMAFAWFADVPVDLAVVEVGMGGRWDATNVLRTAVAVLTPIDVDHRELGDDPVAIAREKSGIIHPGCDVVLGAQAPEVLDVIRARAVEVDAPVRELGRDHGVVNRRVAVGGQVVDLRVGDRVVTDILLPLYGAHQADNAAVALAAWAAMRGPSFADIDDDLIRAGFAATTVPGRLEVVAKDPTVVLDGAHNPHGARATAAALDESFGFRNLVVVLSCLDDKDVEGIVGAFVGHAQHVVVTQVRSPRAASLARMIEAARAAFADTSVIVESASRVEEAVEMAVGVAGRGDGVLVTGSLHTVGEARDVFLPVTDHGERPLVEDEDLDPQDDERFLEAIDEMIERVDEERRPRDDQDAADPEDPSPN